MISEFDKIPGKLTFESVFRLKGKKNILADKYRSKGAAFSRKRRTTTFYDSVNVKSESTKYVPNHSSASI